MGPSASHVALASVLLTALLLNRRHEELPSTPPTSTHTVQSLTDAFLHAYMPYVAPEHPVLQLLHTLRLAAAACEYGAAIGHTMQAPLPAPAPYCPAGQGDAAADTDPVGHMYPLEQL